MQVKPLSSLSHTEVAEYQAVLARAQAALRRERKFLRRALAAHREVQSLFDALQATALVPPESEVPIVRDWRL